MLLYLLRLRFDTYQFSNFENPPHIAYKAVGINKTKIKRIFFTRYMFKKISFNKLLSRICAYGVRHCLDLHADVTFQRGARPPF